MIYFMQTSAKRAEPQTLLLVLKNRLYTILRYCPDLIFFAIERLKCAVNFDEPVEPLFCSYPDIAGSIFINGVYLVRVEAFGISGLMHKISKFLSVVVKQVEPPSCSHPHSLF